MMTTARETHVEVSKVECKLAAGQRKIAQKERNADRVTNDYHG